MNKKIFYNENKLCFRLIFIFIRILQANESNDKDPININCVDPMGRSALLMAIDNENLEMVSLLISYNVDTKDALLHAISEEFVEAVEMLLDHEDCNRNKDGHHVSNFCFLFYFYPSSLNNVVFMCLVGVQLIQK